MPDPLSFLQQRLSPIIGTPHGTDEQQGFSLGLLYLMKKMTENQQGYYVLERPFHLCTAYGTQKDRREMHMKLQQKVREVINQREESKPINYKEELKKFTKKERQEIKNFAGKLVHISTIEPHLLLNWAMTGLNDRFDNDELNENDRKNLPSPSPAHPKAP